MCDIDADDVDEEEADEEQSDGTEGAGAEGQGRGRSRGKRKLRDVDAAGKKAKERGKYQKQEKGKKRCRTPSYMDNDNHSPSGKGYRLMPPTPQNTKLYNIVKICKNIKSYKYVNVYIIMIYKFEISFYVPTGETRRDFTCR
jgi:hypothetical protein